LAALRSEHTASIQSWLQARAQVAAFDSKKDKLVDDNDNLRIAQGKPQGDSALVRQWEELDEKRNRRAARGDRLYRRLSVTGLSVETSPLLDPGFLEKAAPTALPIEAAYWRRKHAEISSQRSRLVLVDDPRRGWRFRILWGPKRVPIEDDGGLIRHTHVLSAFFAEHQAATSSERKELDEAWRKSGGQLYDLRGKSLGRIVGRIRDTQVKIGFEIGNLSGYVDDSRGRLAAVGIVIRRGLAAAIIQAPGDGRHHVYALDPGVKREDLTSPDKDGFGYILTAGSPVAGQVRKLFTADLVELVPGSTKSGAGWRCNLSQKTAGEQAQATIKGLLEGGAFGDAVEDPTTSQTVGQVLVGLIPIVGQVADARDVAIGLHKMWTTGGKDGKVQTLLALVGFVPLFGDLIAKAARGGKSAVSRAINQTITELTPNLAKRITADPDALRRQLPKELFAQAKEMRATTRRISGAKPIKAAEIEQYAKTMSAMLKEFGGDAGALVAASGGSWKKVTRALARKQSGQSKELLEKMEKWRVRQQAWLEKQLAQPAKDLGISRPILVRTGTPSATSDLDLSLLGHASVLDAQAKALLRNRFGPEWAELLDASVFTDPGRMFGWKEAARRAGSGLDPKWAKRTEGRIVADAELNALAKIALGGDADRAYALARKQGINPSRIRKRLRRIQTVRDNPAIRWRLEREVRELHNRFVAAEKAGDHAKQAAIGRDMALKQARLNAAIGDAYGPGGAMKHVIGRERALRGTKHAAMSPAEQYMTLLDDAVMLEKAGAALARVITPATIKSFSKYASRLLVSAGQAGTDFAKKGSWLRGKYDEVADMLQASYKGPVKTRRATRLALNEANVDLKTILDELLAAAKKRALTKPAQKEWLERTGARVAETSRFVTSLTKATRTARIVISAEKVRKAEAERRRRRPH
jgi:hypothetical protein